MIGPTAAWSVLVVPEERLLGEAVAAALVERGFGVHEVDSPDARASTVGLLLAGLDSDASISFARAVLSEYDVPWVVVVHSRREPKGDILDELGAAVVLRSDASVLDVESALAELCLEP